MSTFATLHPVLQALIATIFTWGVTAAGAGMIIFFRSLNQKILDGMLGFTAGVMIAASFWSLLAPAIEMSEGGASAEVDTCSSGICGRWRIPQDS